MKQLRVFGVAMALFTLAVQAQAIEKEYVYQHAATSPDLKCELLSEEPSVGGPFPQYDFFCQGELRFGELGPLGWNPDREILNVSVGYLPGKEIKAEGYSDPITSNGGKTISMRIRHQGKDPYQPYGEMLTIMQRNLFYEVTLR